MGARGHTGVVLRRPSAARRSLGADPYRRLPSIAFQLMREDTPDDVRRRIAAALDLLVPHDTLLLTDVDPGRLRNELAHGAPDGAGVSRPSGGGAHLLEVSLVAHGVLVGGLEVGRNAGDPFDEREVDVLGAFAELAALALYNAHARAELVRLAHTDPLTGLANRRGLARALAAATAPRSLLLLDLDGLKAVNDEVGYEAGDLIIRAAAEALAAEVDEHELAARLGGDEFVALLDSGEAGALERGARVTRALDELALPPAIRARFRGGSVGAVAALPGEDADALLRRAASHMRERKRARRTDRHRLLPG
jgi:diguanylate cyclase (GGDEF)-like protein